MGGIAGIVHFRGDRPDREQAHQLSAGVAHRGPDDKGIWADGPAVLVHRAFRVSRLAVSQPLVREHRVLTADARIYGAGVDSLLDTWIQHGPAGLGRVKGPFAAAIWNSQEQVLWLIRDATGRRPLFWARQGARVAFASEMAPLLGLPWVSRELAVDHLAEHLSFRYVHAPRTLLRDVLCVPPGHAVRIDAAGARPVRWWAPDWAPMGSPAPDDRDVVDQVHQALRRSVTRRLSGEERPAVLLSGGLDSSAILHHAATAGTPPACFTVSLSDDPADESAFAARVAKVMGADHHLVRLDTQDLLGTMRAATRAMGQPLTSAAAVLQGLLFKEIRPISRVVLSGDGGDEVLGGRAMADIAARLRRNRTLSRLPGPLRGFGRRAARRAGMKDLGASQAHFGCDRNIGGSSVFHSHERVAVLRDLGMVRPGIRRVALEPLYQEIDSDPLNEILHVWQRGWLAEDSLTRSDRMAAHTGVEVRYPMLDTDLVRLTCSLPGGTKVHHSGLGFTTKWPLREAMVDVLPASLLNRPKRSLPNPLATWLRGAGRDFLRDSVESLSTSGSDLFVPAEVRRLANAHLQGHRDHGLKLWTLCLLQMWREELRA